MSCRPNIEVESKREFLAQINLGFKSEYEFENGSDCYEFITKELGVNENEDSNGLDYIGHECFLLKIANSKTDKCMKISNDTDNENDDLVPKRIIEKNNCIESHINKNFFFNKADKKINNSDISTQEETYKNLLDSITKAVNFNNIEIIYDSDENEDKQLQNDTEIVLEENKNYQCYICNHNFLNKASRRQHLSLHFKYGTKLTTCPFCGKSFTNKNELNKHFTSHLTKVSEETSKKQCKICSKTFSKIPNLTRHLNKAHGKENVLSRCNLCSRRFNEKTHLESHMLRHSNQGEFKCNICQKLFAKKQYLNKHLKLHPSNKTYNCDICFKQFVGKHIFQNHYAKHLTSGKSNYNCRVCKKTFFSMFLLNYHLKIKHRLKNQYFSEIPTEDYSSKINNLKSFSCSFCSKKFKNKSQFVKHVKYHKAEKEFKCNDCSNAFYSKYHLQRHMTVHTGLKNFECPVCLKRFTTRYHLRCHLKVHTLPTKYNCLFCYKTFSTLNSYMRHRKEHER